MLNIPTGSKWPLSILTASYSHLVLSRHRQTVFYTPSTIIVSEGQKVTGHVSCSPNAKNNRDLDIAISYQTGNDAKDTHIQYKMCVTSVLYPHCTLRLYAVVFLERWPVVRSWLTNPLDDSTRYALAYHRHSVLKMRISLPHIYLCYCYYPILLCQYAGINLARTTYAAIWR